MKRAAIYLRVSTQDQTTSNQEHELRQAAERAGWQVAKLYKDHGISGAKGRNGRPAFDALCRDATKRQFDVVMAWNVDRLGRSLKDLACLLRRASRNRSSTSLPTRSTRRSTTPTRVGDLSISAAIFRSSQSEVSSHSPH